MSVHLLLLSAPESFDIFLGSKSRSYLDLFTESAESCGLGDEVIQSCERAEATYVPSIRFDSGMTRSSVLGSTEMPDGVVSGNRAGLDMIQLQGGIEDR